MREGRRIIIQVKYPTPYHSIAEGCTNITMVIQRITQNDASLRGRMEEGISHKTAQKSGRLLLIPLAHKLTKELYSADDPSLTQEGLVLEWHPMTGKDDDELGSSVLTSRQTAPE